MCRPAAAIRSVTTKGIPDMSRTRAIAFSALGGAVAAVLTTSVVFAETPFASLGNMGGGFGRRRDGGGFFFFPLLLLAAVVVLLVVLWRGRHPVAPLAGPPMPSAAPPSPTLNAQAILADRLARGEISPDDYRAAITVLRDSPPPPVG
jgi:putative membrane protein